MSESEFNRGFNEFFINNFIPRRLHMDVTWSETGLTSL